MAETCMAQTEACGACTGITGTPVIDPDTDTVYVISYSVEGADVFTTTQNRRGGSSAFRQCSVLEGLLPYAVRSQPGCAAHFSS